MRAAFPALLGLIFGCNGPAGPDPDTEAVTWTEHLHPVMQRTCWRCHDGQGVGPGDFTNYEIAAAYAHLMAHKVEDGKMPPAVADPDCRPYDGAENMNVSDEERALFRAWAEDGAPEGDPAFALTPLPPVVLEDPDLRIEMPLDFEVQVQEDGNQYACFILEHGQSADFFLTALDVDLGNPEVVHHLVLFRDPNHRGGTVYGGAQEGGWFDCRNPIMDPQWEPLHAWAPGMPPTRFHEGTGLKVGADDQLILQMHYFAAPGSTHHDRSAYLVHTEPAVDRELYFIPLGPTGFTIPAGDPAYTLEWSYSSSLPVAVDLFGVFPHMHLLGSAYQAEVRHADGRTSCMVQADRWDFHNQITYLFEEPIRAEPGDVIHTSCTWNNSADNHHQFNDPPTDVHWGEGTNEEMCFFLTYGAVAL